MKKWFIVLFVFFYMQTTAQNAELRKYPLTTVSDVAGFSVLNILDSYLSPLTYSGMAIFYERTGQKLFSPENTSVSMQGRFRTLAGLTVNPQSTASITYLGAGYSWGAYYHFQITNELRLQAGSLIDAGFAVKQNARNVNNPYNFDLATNLNLSANANYDIATKRRTIRVSFGFETPLMGCMFVPESGMSYYELFGLKNYTNAVHFSSLHNKQGLSVHTSIEIPFKYSTWKFGIGSNELKYKANDMVFKHNEYMLLIGLKYNLYRFIGTKNSAPENFISTYK
ncbi:MAG: DUF3316 domain-containing protein [Paludibacter sp.]|nr:DUF3316 domain-containing protein [Paludibacter sp.]